MTSIYLDNNATTQPAPEVVAAMALTLTEAWQNPSSVHRGGQVARRSVELARQQTAALIGAQPKHITFTSGGTEAADLAIRGTLLALPPAQRVVVTAPVEHSAVRELLEELAKREGVEVRWCPVSLRGELDWDALAALLRPGADGRRVGLVSMQWANNETGVVTPIGRVAAMCSAANAGAESAMAPVVHCDATQWIGKMPTRVEAGEDDAGDGQGSDDAMSAWCPADLITFAPHKFHGPKGVGVLYARRGTRLVPRLIGTQEQGRRAGTENVPGIVGCGAACELAAAWLAEGGARGAGAVLRDGFEQRVVAECAGLGVAAVVNGAGAPRLWNTTNIGFARLEAEALLLALSERGVAASAGAACSSGSLEPSPVLLAMGIAPAVAHGSLRFSLSRISTTAEVVEAAAVVLACVARVARSSGVL